MTQRRIGIIGVIAIMLASGVWVALPKRNDLRGSVAGDPVTEIPVHASQVPGSFAAIKADEVLNLWARIWVARH